MVFFNYDFFHGLMYFSHFTRIISKNVERSVKKIRMYNLAFYKMFPVGKQIVDFDAAVFKFF